MAGLIADEAGAGLVLADRDQHVADRGAMETPEYVNDDETDRRDEGIERQRGIEGEAGDHRSPDAPRPFSPPVTSVHRNAIV